MSISSEVNNTQGQIRAIPDPDNTIKGAKDAAIDAADDVLSEWRRISELARTAKSNDNQILERISQAQQKLETELQQARQQLEESLSKAQQDFETTVTTITDAFATSVWAIKTIKSESDGVHDDIIRTAS